LPVDATLVDLLGKTRHRKWMRWAWSAIAVIGGDGQKVRARICPTELSEFPLLHDDWWAGPQWPGLVDAFINQLREHPPGMTIGGLRDGLLNAPDMMDPEVLDWCVAEQLIGYTRVKRDNCA
jgi:hypothetical protein